MVYEREMVPEYYVVGTIIFLFLNLRIERITLYKLSIFLPKKSSFSVPALLNNLYGAE